MKSLHFSAASSWTNCPGVLDFESPKDISRERSGADKGDRFHNLCEAFLTLLPSDYSYESAVFQVQSTYPQEKFFKDEEERNEFLKWGELVWNKIKYDWDDLEGKKTLSLELPLVFEIDKNWRVSGRSDAILFSPNRIIIYDFKTGFIEVEAFDNEQLKITAEVLFAYGNHQSMAGVIIQPPLGTVDTSELNPEGDVYWDRLKKILAKKEKPLKAGKQCTYCHVADICPEFRKHIENFSNPLYLDQKINRPEKWSEILELAKPIRKALENIEATALAAAKSGIEIPGWKLDGRNGKRTWNHNMHAFSLAKWLGLKRTDVIDEKLVSPAEIEKKIKTEKQKEKFGMIISQPLYYALKKDSGVEIFRKFEKDPNKTKKKEKLIPNERELGKALKKEKVIKEKKTAGKTAKKSVKSTRSKKK